MATDALTVSLSFFKESTSSPLRLSFIVVPLVITFISTLLRILLFQRLTYYIRYAWAIVTPTETSPSLLRKLQKEVLDLLERLDEVNTVALVESSLARERLLFGLSLEQVEYITRSTPNLLVAIGLLGTFLGILINLTGITTGLAGLIANSPERGIPASQLIEKLGQPLEGMAIAFTSSLVSLLSAIILAAVNSIWNTTLARRHLSAEMELHLDHALASRQQSPVRQLVKSISESFRIFLDNFHQTVREAIEQPLEREMEKIRDMNSRNAELAERIYTSFDRAAGNLVTGSRLFEETARSLEHSRVPQEFVSAAERLSQAAHQLSQASYELVDAATRSQALNVQMVDLFRQVSETLDRVNHTQFDFQRIIESVNSTAITLLNIQEGLQQLLTRLEKVSDIIRTVEGLSRIAVGLDDLTSSTRALQDGLSPYLQELSDNLSLIADWNIVNQNQIFIQKLGSIQERLDQYMKQPNSSEQLNETFLRIATLTQQMVNQQEVLIRKLDAIREKLDEYGRQYPRNGLRRWVESIKHFFKSSRQSR
ncbi:MAG: hypothetical protein NZ821_02260 [Gloeomargarita sp. SKYB31]|nr:hypothetical protein [Gloeomargarita sp. SKYB31]